MQGYLYRAAHPRTAFAVIRVIARGKRSLNLEIETPTGPVKA